MTKRNRKIRNKNEVKDSLTYKRIGNREVIITDNAIDYVKKMGYIVIKPNIAQIREAMFGAFIFIVSIMLISFAGGQELGLTKSYDRNITLSMSNFIKEDFNPKYGVITLTSPISKIAEYSLTKNTEYCLSSCEAEGKVTLYEDGYIFDNVKFKSMNGKPVNIESSNYKLFKGYEDNFINIPVYGEICKEVIDNKSQEMKKECNQEIIDYKQENIPLEVWDDYTNDKLTAGSYRWKIMGKKNPFQSVDFIPVIHGKEFSEWAVWNSSYTLGLLGYYKFDELPSGVARANNSITGVSFLTTEWHQNASGLINYAYTCQNEGGFNSTFSIINNNSVSVNYWVYKQGGFGADSYFISGGTGVDSAEGRLEGVTTIGTDLKIGTYSGAWKTYTFTPNTNKWVMISILANSTALNVWINGTLKSTQALSGTWVMERKELFFCGSSLGTGKARNITLDEVGFWNRQLSPSEITDLYNGGLGISYIAPLPNMLNVTLNSPVNNTATNGTAITFNCSSFDEIGVTNLTLIINGLHNYTIFNTTESQNITLNRTLNFPSNSSNNWTCLASDGTNLFNASLRYFTIGVVPISTDVIFYMDLSTTQSIWILIIILIIIGIIYLYVHKVIGAVLLLVVGVLTLISLTNKLLGICLIVLAVLLALGDE